MNTKVKIPKSVLALLGAGLLVALAWFGIGNFLFRENVPVNKVYFDPNTEQKGALSVISNVLPKKKTDSVSLPRVNVLKPTDVSSDNDKKEDESCHGSKKIQLEAGKFSCKDYLSFALPEDFTPEMVKENMIRVAQELYAHDKAFSFAGNTVSDMIVVHNRPPEGSFAHSSDVYIGTLKNEKGQVTAVVNLEHRGMADGKAYFAFPSMYPQGDSYVELPSSVADDNRMSGKNVTLEQIQDMYRYPFETFPPVTETMADGYVQDYLKENQVDGVNVERVGYSNAYDYRGRALGDNNIGSYHEYVVTDNQGQQSSILVNTTNGLVADSSYIDWYTEEADYMVAHEMDQSFVERGVDPPQQPRFTVNRQPQQALPQ